MRKVAHPAAATAAVLPRPNAQERFRRELFPPAVPQPSPGEADAAEFADAFFPSLEGLQADPPDSDDEERGERQGSQDEPPQEDERDGAPAQSGAPAAAPEAQPQPPPRYFFIQGDTLPPPLAHAPSAAEPGEDLPGDRPPVQGAGAMGTATDAQPPKWLIDTAQIITDLCRRADPAFQSLSVTVPMDPQVLPDCELALGLSSYAMTLRFHTVSSESRRLISLHRDQLHGLLSRLSTNPQRSIDIDLE
ncbi:type III secretion HpaP family protein [Acidovorax sp. SUPP3334]|uniref:type III secretion HpaP family protein n=1 Tax=Acidovorax sp. SUPP3334 TaxID=2920881 RepID=UPI0023DE409A|nr:type III secretion HpaP family protein [Acidovorax sp. SUPP3334]GKT20946.1 type III secretion HpaP family protein [Acidovorax sp. SUPP3334]